MKYKVGYGKPPKHTQWKPGQSGNPKGRSKKIAREKILRKAMRKLVISAIKAQIEILEELIRN